jgi:TIR domain
MSSLADLPEVIGFFSYSREDDEAYKGRLSVLREAIQEELGAQLGRSKSAFRLWQDKEAIAPGKLWESEITNSVEQSVFFIPIVTPRMMNSRYCQFEFDAFLTRERALGRSDLIFPILYVPVPALADETRWRNHPVLSPIAERQYVDWQKFRYVDAPTPVMREEIARFCNGIVEALHKPWLSPEERNRRGELERQKREEERRRQEPDAKQRADEESHRKRDEAEAQRLNEGRRPQRNQRADQEPCRKREETEAGQRAEMERQAREAEAKRRAEEETRRRRDEAQAGRFIRPPEPERHISMPTQPVATAGNTDFVLGLSREPYQIRLIAGIVIGHSILMLATMILVARTDGIPIFAPIYLTDYVFLTGTIAACATLLACALLFLRVTWGTKIGRIVFAISVIPYAWIGALALLEILQHDYRSHDILLLVSCVLGILIMPAAFIYFSKSSRENR